MRAGEGHHGLKKQKGSVHSNLQVQCLDAIKVYNVQCFQQSDQVASCRSGVLGGLACAANIEGMCCYI